ncbi:MAG: hypothetical protein JO021_24260 [Alphaproteobacteria bacterium]|nr:hypothetical protein [Alphaproteobacteria bacterium]
MKNHYDDFLRAVGWIGTIIALSLLGVNLVLHLDYAPFKNPGMAPGPERLDALYVDAARCVITAITGCVCGMRLAPRKRSRFQPGPGSSVAVPLAALLGVIVAAALSIVCWIFWMKGLPGGDRMRNLWLAGGYFAIPAALLLTFAVSLFSRPPE